VKNSHECFEDEVAIDFPSLDAAVERMRDAFLLHDGDTLHELATELCLSTREAFDGVTLPLEVPVRTLCRVCGGRGEVWSEPCATCAGVGHAMARHAVRLVVPPRARDGNRFCLLVSAPSSSPTRIEVRVAIRS
jgi:hypothetical protein